MISGNLINRFLHKYIQQINTKHIIKFFCAVVVAALAVFFVLLQSPLLPRTNLYPYTDSSVFQLIAEMLLDGGMPYRDVFDHKGPLIYLIDALGYLIHGDAGIWVLEFGALFVTEILWYFSFRLLDLPRIWSLILSVLLLFGVGGSLEGGNFLEEFSLPFLSFTAYSYLKISNKGCLSKINLVLLGLSCFAILMLKFPAVLIQIPFLIAICFLLFKRNQLGRGTAAFLLGLFIPTLIICCWLFLNDALNSFVDDYILYNLFYAGRMKVLDRIESVIYFASSFIFMLSVILSLFLIVLKRLRKEVLVNFASLILGFGITATSGYCFGHYAMFFFPCYVIPLGLALKFLLELPQKQFAAFSCLLTLLLVVNCALPAMRECIYYAQLNERSTAAKIPLIECIKAQGVEDKEKIAVIGNACWIYRYASFVSICVHPSV